MLMPTPTLDVVDLGLTYNTATGPLEALRDVSLSIADGEFVAIVGPSGCGKSSLLKLILGLERASVGSLSIAGSRITQPTRGVGAVFQSPVLLPWRTIFQNVLLPADVMKLDKRVARARATDLLRMAGLEGFGERYPFELSGGMQQRAGIVRALVHDPKLLIMDEPFAALDAMTRETMSVELQRIWMESGKTVVFITHSISEAVFLADRILVMSPRPGRIIADIANQFARPRSFIDLAGPEMAALAVEIRETLDAAHAA